MRGFLTLAAVALALVAGAHSRAQDAAPLNLDFGSDETPKNDTTVLQRVDATGVYRLRVRYVKVEGRWSDRVALPLTAGEVLTPEKLSAAMEVLRAAITAPPRNQIALRSKGEVGVLYLEVKFDSSPATDANGVAQPASDTVGVIFRPYYVDVSLVQIGNNILPIPRGAWPDFDVRVPKWIRSLHPTFGVSYDRAFGTAVSLGLAGDLPRPLRASDDSQQFGFHFDGTKSLEESYYRVNGGVRYGLHRDSGFLRELSFTADFDGTKEPLGDATHTQEAGVAALGAKLNLAPNVRLDLDAGYRRTDDRLDHFPTAIDANANEQHSRLLLDLIPPVALGFLRAALWQESAWQTSGLGNSYQHLVGRVGYEKEIPIALNQTIGIEVIAGAGHAFGNTPEYAKFFGGNPPGQFLYDGPDATSLMKMPSGPILRSFGENEARLAGGASAGGADTFWHVNLTVTFPIPALSRSLIPNEATDIEDASGNPITIKQLLKRQINVTGPSMLRAVLRSEGLGDAEIERQVRETFQEITPATNFIIDQANLYAVKPLLMFDAAGLSDGNGQSETWLAAGGGLQLTIVTAKLEVGYVQTLNGPREGQGGNAFVRLVFQNLF
ncbi:MAG: hypothetical protein ACR2NX_07995 [Chthoniobacterales bacterium]